MPDHIDGMLIARELADLKGRLTKQPLTHATLDKWLKEAPDRAKFFQNTFWGSIRWPKTLGRMPGRLSNGFSLKLQNEFDIKSVGAGGEIIDKTGWIDMPSPSMWDVDDDEAHYRVDYFGSCAKKTLTTVTNRLEIKIVGTWDNPGKFARFLLPNPLGYSFGNFDGRPIVLAEATVEQHLLTPKQPWKLPKLGKLIDS